MEPVIPYGSVGAIIAFVRRAIVRAIAVGAVLSAPLFTTPCGSSVPVGSRTVVILDGTVSLNSIQLIRSISRVDTKSRSVCAEMVLNINAQIRMRIDLFMSRVERYKPAFRNAMD